MHGQSGACSEREIGKLSSPKYLDHGIGIICRWSVLYQVYECTKYYMLYFCDVSGRLRLLNRRWCKVACFFPSPFFVCFISPPFFFPSHHYQHKKGIFKRVLSTQGLAGRKQDRTWVRCPSKCVRACVFSRMTAVLVFGARNFVNRVRICRSRHQFVACNFVVHAVWYACAGMLGWCHSSQSFFWFLEL